jgi:hypothetical protein
MTAGITIIDACNDPQLFGRFFRDKKTWWPWFVFLKSLFGLPMDESELAFFRECTRLDAPPEGGSREAWLVIGRRGGKSRILATIAVYLATIYKDWRPYLAPGERGVVTVLAQDRRQARVIFRYLSALIKNVPMLRDLIQRETADSIDLNNCVTIEIQAASFRSVRGYTIVAALLDEIAFWRSDDSANPDHEVLAAIRPAMATVPGALLLAGSSPYARRGELYNNYRRHYGKPGSVLVFKAAIRAMNPSVPEQVIRDAFDRDPASAAAEYGAEFRSDVETFVSREVVDTAIAPGRHELPRVSGTNYVAFVDPSGGSSDAMAIALAHLDRKTNSVILDAVRERKPPFSPEAVVEDFAQLLKSYGIGRVTGDRYAGEWPRERFRVHGIAYECADKPKSDIYRDLLPLLNSGRIELLDNSRLITQLCALERRTARGGRDSIDHPPGAHDDLINSAAGALVGAVGKPAIMISSGLIQRASVQRRRPVAYF